MLNNIIPEFFESKNTELQIRVEAIEENKILELLERKFPNTQITQKGIVKLSIIGYGIIQDNVILNKVINILKNNKIEIIVKEIENYILEE